MNSPLGSLAHISHFLQQPGDFGHLANKIQALQARTQFSTAVDLSFEDILKIFEAGFQIVFNILRRSMAREIAWSKECDVQIPRMVQFSPQGPIQINV